MSAVEVAAKVLAWLISPGEHWHHGTNADQERALALGTQQAEALAEAGLLRVDGETRTEWGVRFDNGNVFETRSERAAGDLAGVRPTSSPCAAVSRTVTTYPDAVTPWAEVPS